MIWQIFSLYPQIFESFLKTSLIARAIDKKILEFELINWRVFGTGNYKQVDDRPFGGGSGMVLQVEPIVKALRTHDSLSDFGKKRFAELEKLEVDNLNSQKNSQKNQSLNKNFNPILRQDYSSKVNFETKLVINSQINLPKNNQIKNQLQIENPPPTLLYNLTNNSKFYHWTENLENSQKNQINLKKNIKKATILLTPRGFPLDQKICHWLSEFDQISLICGRFEGFDYRLNKLIDLEISIGDFVCNGGEVPAMCLIEAVSRLIPGFITKPSSHLHDSFSVQNNEYLEQKEFVIGKNKLKEFEIDYHNLEKIKNKLLDIY